jgi:HPr kinase/phosphorylase
MEKIHGTCVSIGQTGVLIRGPSGAGKSDLALRLMDRGAVLVSDDYCDVEKRGADVILRAPPTIAGQMELRGLGIMRTAQFEHARLGLIVDLVDGNAIERLPTKTAEAFAGVQIAWMQVDPREASADAKVRLVARALAGEVTIDADGELARG